MSRRVRAALLIRSFLPQVARVLWHAPAELGGLRQLWSDYTARFSQMAILSGRNQKAVERMFYELECTTPIVRPLRARAEVPVHAILSYVLVRLVAPDVVVETRGADGITSRFILEAMDRNGRGFLHSVDLPNRPSPAAAERSDDGGHSGTTDPGGLMRPELRSRWHLHPGEGEAVLPRLLSDVGEIDVFIRGSAPTYERMMFEYGTVWPHLRPGGILCSDHIGRNSAFADFAAGVSGRPVVFAEGVGGLRKQPIPSPAQRRKEEMKLQCFICASPFWPDDPLRDEELHLSYLRSQIQSLQEAGVDATIIQNGCEFPSLGLPWIRNPIPKNMSYNLLICDANCRGDYWIFLPEDCLVSPAGWQAIRERADRECFALSTDPKAIVCRKGIFRNLPRELYSLCDMNFLGKEFGCLLLRRELERRGLHCITRNWMCISEDPKRWGNELYAEMNRPEAPYDINQTRRLPTLHDYGLPGYRASVREIEETFVKIVRKSLDQLFEDACRMKGLISKFGPITTDVEYREWGGAGRAGRPRMGGGAGCSAADRLGSSDPEG